MRFTVACLLTAVLTAVAGCVEDPADEITAATPDGLGVITLSINETSTVPVEVPLVVSNTGTCPLAYNTSWTTASGGDWLAVTANGTGTISPGGSATLTVEVGINPPAIPPGTYPGTITIAGDCTLTGNAAVGSPRSVAVNLTVTADYARLGVDDRWLGVDLHGANAEWQPMSTVGAPAPRYAPTCTWTGEYMLVTGGVDNPTGLTSSEARLYDPRADQWLVTGSMRYPRWGHAAALDASSGLVYLHGMDSENPPTLDSAQMDVYDPLNGQFDIASEAHGDWRHLFSLVSIGPGRLIVWGGFRPGIGPVNTGYVFTAGAGPGDVWSPMTTTGAPTARWEHDAAWTGTEMLVWGEGPQGGAYNPNTDTWRPLSPTGAPAGWYGSTAVWSGRLLLVFGGTAGNDVSLGSGGAYDPWHDAWSPISAVNAPGPRDHYTAVWTGSHLVVWGGNFGDGTNYDILNDGGMYNPEADTWTPLPGAGAPSPRGYHCAVWTGDQMLVFGGADYTGDLNTGGRLVFSH